MLTHNSVQSSITWQRCRGIHTKVSTISNQQFKLYSQEQQKSLNTNSHENYALKSYHKYLSQSIVTQHSAFILFHHSYNHQHVQAEQSLSCQTFEQALHNVLSTENKKSRNMFSAYHNWQGKSSKTLLTQWNCKEINSLKNGTSHRLMMQKDYWTHILHLFQTQSLQLEFFVTPYIVKTFV